MILKNVSLRAKRNSPQPIHYAGFLIRLKAFALDYLIVLAYIIILAGINYGFILFYGGLDKIFPIFTSLIVKDAFAFLTLILPVILYFSLYESSCHQATWGKRKVGLKVVNADGGRLTYPQALIRTGIKFIPWQIAHTSIYQIQGIVSGTEATPINYSGFVLVYALVGIYILSAVISKRHRTPYDWVVGSYVVWQ